MVWHRLVSSDKGRKILPGKRYSPPSHRELKNIASKQSRVDQFMSSTSASDLI
jgi:hypothetical protein